MQDLKPFSPDYNKKCFLPGQKATSDTFSLFTITYYFQKISSAEGEKWRVKSEKWRGKKISSEQVRGIFLVAEVGFFIALSPSCVVLCATHSLASKLALCATPFAKTPHRGVFAALTHSLRRRFAAVGAREWFKAHRSKRKSRCDASASSFGCGGGIWTSRPPGY